MSSEVFVALSTFAEYGEEPVRLLEESGVSFAVNERGRRLERDEIVSSCTGAAGIVAGVEPYDEQVLRDLPALRCISRCGVGIDNIDLDVALDLGIEVRNTPDVVVQPVAELTIAMILDMLRHLSYSTAQLRARRWTKKAGNLLAGKTVGIVGLGRIGRRVAEMLRALAVDVVGSDLAPDTEWAERHGVRVESTDDVIRGADILSLHLAVPPGNRFVLDRQAISEMKPGAWLVNVSRGTFLDERALCDALASGHLSGAALDVFSEEPYEGPLCDFDNVVLTPHVATLTRESRVEMESQAVRNLLESLAGA